MSEKTTRAEAVGILSGRKYRMLKEAKLSVVRRSELAAFRQAAREMCEIGNDVLNGKKELSDMDDALARLHRTERDLDVA